MVRAILPDALGIIPRNQKDRDYLGDERNKQLRRKKVVSYVAFFLSIVSMVTGVAAIVTSAPDFNFPYTLGGGCMAGFVCILMVLVSRKMVQEGRKTPAGDLTTSRMSCLGALQSTLMVIMAFVGIMSFGLSGMLGLAYCTKPPKNPSANPCTPDKEAKLILSVMTAAISIILIIITLTLTCLYCCHQRAFGLKSPYEMVLERREFHENRVRELITKVNDSNTSDVPAYSTHTILLDPSAESDTRSIAYDIFRDKFRYIEISNGKIKKMDDADALFK